MTTNVTFYVWGMPGSNITLKPNSSTYAIFGPSIEMIRMYVIGNLTIYSNGHNPIVRAIILNTSCINLSLNSFNQTQLERFYIYDSGYHKGSISFSLDVPITSSYYCFLLVNPTGVNETIFSNTLVIVTVRELQT
jgi:hypothetical protein